MVSPDKVQMEAKKKEEENYKFRTYLKIHADEKTLDRQFLELHNELFGGYDCRQCRNCCKLYQGSIPERDVARDADYLGMSQEHFLEYFLEKEEYESSYLTKHKPCDFLMENGDCKLGECKPDSCKKYPYTDQPGRLGSLLGLLDIISICPIAFEIYERLKTLYRFRSRR